MFVCVCVCVWWGGGGVGGGARADRQTGVSIDPLDCRRVLLALHQRMQGHIVGTLLRYLAAPHATPPSFTAGQGRQESNPMPTGAASVLPAGPQCRKGAKSTHHCMGGAAPRWRQTASLVFLLSGAGEFRLAVGRALCMARCFTS